MNEEENEELSKKPVKKIADIYDKKSTTEESIDKWMRIIGKYWRILVGAILALAIVIYAIVRIVSVGVG